MASRNVETHRAGHEAFNRRDFAAMTEHYADDISLDRPRPGAHVRHAGRVQDDFLAGWLGVSSDIRITDARYLDAGPTVVSTFTVEAGRTGRSDRSPPPARSSRCRCARCGTSTPPARSSAATSTTTSSRYSPTSA